VLAVHRYLGECEKIAPYLQAFPSQMHAVNRKPSIYIGVLKWQRLALSWENVLIVENKLLSVINVQIVNLESA
jgi:hypothetical protein